MKTRTALAKVRRKRNTERNRQRARSEARKAAAMERLLTHEPRPLLAIDFETIPPPGANPIYDDLISGWQKKE